MAAEDLYLCCALYFSAPRAELWVQPFWKFSIEYASELGQEITHFVPVQHDSKDWRCKTYRYIKRNQKYLTEGEVDINLKVLDFCCVGKDGDFLMSPFMISIRNHQKEKNYGIVFFQCQKNILLRNDMSTNFIRRFVTDLNSIIEIKYGFVHLMEGKKYPCAYCEDMATSIHLTNEEEDNVRLWEREGRRFQDIVRGVYWGNIISRRHLGNDVNKEKYLIHELNNICKGNVFWISNDLLFFSAPWDIIDCRKKEIEFYKFKHNILNIFRQCNIEILTANYR